MGCFVKLFVEATLRLCLIYSGRGGESLKESLVIRSTDDLGQSVLAAGNLVQDGLINPIKPELRYVIESSVKASIMINHGTGKSFGFETLAGLRKLSRLNVPGL